MPYDKIGKALEGILEKFYLNMDIMDKSEDYAMSEVILSKLSEDYGQQFRRECMAKLPDRILQNTSDWKEIFESIMYQLLLPLELGQRLYHAKVRLINKKFEINTMWY